MFWKYTVKSSDSGPQACGLERWQPHFEKNFSRESRLHFPMKPSYSDNIRDTTTTKKDLKGSQRVKDGPYAQIPRREGSWASGPHELHEFRLGTPAFAPQDPDNTFPLYLGWIWAGLGPGIPRFRPGADGGAAAAAVSPWGAAANARTTTATASHRPTTTQSQLVPSP